MPAGAKGGLRACGASSTPSPSPSASHKQSINIIRNLGCKYGLDLDRCSKGQKISEHPPHFKTSWNHILSLCKPQAIHKYQWYIGLGQDGKGYWGRCPKARKVWDISWYQVVLSASHKQSHKCFSKGILAGPGRREWTQTLEQVFKKLRTFKKFKTLKVQYCGPGEAYHLNCCHK